MSLRLSVSSIAFPPSELDDALALLSEIGIGGVEIAPFNAFGRWDVSDADVAALRDRLIAAGLECPALQGILFNAGEVHLFRSNESREILFRHLVGVARMAEILGAKACVFGAPKVRDPGDLPPDQARAIAVAFLRRIGPVFAERGSAIAFEPNAAAYACRFVTTTEEAIDFVREIATLGVGLQIDTGTCILEREAPVVLAAAAPLAVHAHVSEAGLAPIGTTGADHEALAVALRGAGYHGSLSIEMKSVAHWRQAVRDAVSLVRQVYIS